MPLPRHLDEDPMGRYLIVSLSSISVMTCPKQIIHDDIIKRLKDESILVRLDAIRKVGYTNIFIAMTHVYHSASFTLFS